MNSKHLQLTESILDILQNHPEEVTEIKNDAFLHSHNYYARIDIKTIRLTSSVYNLEIGLTSTPLGIPIDTSVSVKISPSTSQDDRQLQENVTKIYCELQNLKKKRAEIRKALEDANIQAMENYILDLLK